MINLRSHLRQAYGIGALLLIGISIGAVSGTSATAPKRAHAKTIGKASANQHRVSARFVENKGQWDSRARFLGRTPGIDTWVTETSVYFDAYQSRMVSKRQEPYKKKLVPSGTYRKGQVIRMDFVGGRAASLTEGRGELSGRFNYFTAGAKVSDAHSFQESRMQGIWPGIDLRLYFQSEKPRYDFIVAPGADPAQIKVNFQGAESVALRSATELTLGTQLGPLSVSGLVAYQMNGQRRANVPASFVVDGKGQVGFQIGHYDRSRDLIIDPVVFSTYLGGVGSVDIGNGVAVDRFNKPYVCGSATAATFPTTIGAYDEELVAVDAFISKFFADGSDLEYSTYLGGGALSDRFNTPADPLTYAPGWDDWERIQNDLPPYTPDDIANAIAVDFDGNAYVVGITNCVDFPVTVGAAISTYNEPPEIPFREGSDFFEGFVTKIAPDGKSLVWSTFMGGQRLDRMVGLALGVDNSVFVIGDTQSENYPTVNALQPAMQGDGDACVTRLSANGSTILYSTYLGGTDLILPNDPFLPWESSVPLITPEDPMNPFDNTHTHGDDDGAIGIRVDSDGFAYALVQTTFADAPTVPGSYDTVPNGQDSLIVKIAQDGGSLVYGTFMGGNDSDFGTGIALDATGNVYITGVTFSFNYPRTPGAFDAVYNLGIDCFITKLNRLGNGLVYSTFLGTANGCQPLAITVDDIGFAHVTGLSSQSIVQAGVRWLPVTANADQLDYRGPADPFLSVGDAFLMVLNDTGTGMQYCGYWGGSQPDLGLGLALDTSRNAYLTGFTQSDAPSPVPFPTTPGAFKTGLVRDAIPIALPDAFLSKIKTRIPVAIQSLTITPNSVPSGDSATGTVTLSAPATTGGALVTLSNSNNSVVSHPTSIMIPAGQNSGTFQIDTTPNIVTVQVVQITATTEGDFKTASITVKPWLESFTLSNTSVVGGNPMAARVTLSFPAPTGGMTIQLSSTNTSVATVPPTVTVLEGTLTTVFDVTTLGVASVTPVDINASLNGLTKTQTLSVLPASLVELSFTPTRVTGGTSSTGLARLNGSAPPGGVTVALSSNNPAVQVPASVVIAAQTPSATFVATTSVVSVNQTAIVSATLGVNTVQATLDVLVGNLISFTIVPNSILGGNPTTGIVELDRPAATGGVTITLSSSNPLVASVPSTVVIPSGSTNANFVISTVIVPTTTNVTISADRDGAGAIPPLTANLEVRAVGFTISIDPPSVPGGDTAIGTVTLDEAAPQGGITITLESDIPEASVPATVTVLEGETEATFDIDTVTVPADVTATITGTFLLSSASATLDILAAVPISLSITPSSVVGGVSAIGTVTLSGAAPSGGVLVGLSSNNAAVIPPASVVVPEGQTSTSFSISTTGVLVDVTAIVTATVGSTSVTDTLTVTAAILIDLNFMPSRVRGPATTLMTLTLNAQAPPGGAVVSLTSSDPTLANIPSTVTILPGTTSRSVTITTRRVSRTLATQVSATYGTSTRFAVLTVTR